MDSPILSPATCQAVQSFLDDNNHFILKLSQDNQGQACLKMASKGLWTWFAARILKLKNYQLTTVIRYIQDHQKAFEQFNLGSSKKIEDFYQTFNQKITHYNQKRIENKKINVTLTPLFQAIHPIVIPVSSSSNLAFEKLKTSPFFKNKNELIGLTTPSSSPFKSIPTAFPSPHFYFSKTRKRKRDLIIFYLQQQAHLIDLNNQLQFNSGAISKKIENKIYEIEKNDLERIKISLKVQGIEPTLAIHK